MNPRLEKIEQAETVKLLATLGGAVYILGTRRPRGRSCPACGAVVPESQSTRQTPGLPDLLAFLPGCPGAVLFVEQKRVGGRLSPAQQDFRALAACSTASYVSGALDDVIAWLEARGYVRGRR